MTRRALFKNGKHPSRWLSHRNDGTASPTKRWLASMLGDVSEPDYLSLVVEIERVKVALARTPIPTRKDVVAQLLAMKKITGNEELVKALAGCDSRTFTEIQLADLDFIARTISRHGVFVDSDGDECRIPPEIEILPPTHLRAIGHHYLPSGVIGIRKAIRLALFRASLRLDNAGNREKSFQSALARECVFLWIKYCSSKPLKAWNSRGTDRHSELVRFGRETLGMAGVFVGNERVADLLKPQIAYFEGIARLQVLRALRRLLVLKMTSAPQKSN